MAGALFRGSRAREMSYAVRHDCPTRIVRREIGPPPVQGRVGPMPAELGRQGIFSRRGSSVDRMSRSVKQFGLGFQALAVLPNDARIAMLRWLGLHIGAHVAIYPHVFFGSEKCAIGDGSFVSVNCFFDGSDRITIGQNVSVAAGVQLITSTHDIGPPSRRAGALRGAPVVIGNGCWLGASCIVLPGVTVAEGCVVAAGAVVAKSTEPNGLYAGVPARRVRTLETATSKG